jgi:protein involved in polysaccharide export with SLBB domain
MHSEYRRTRERVPGHSRLLAFGLGLVVFLALTVSGDAQTSVIPQQALDQLQQLLQQRSSQQNNNTDNTGTSPLQTTPGTSQTLSPTTSTLTGKNGTQTTETPPSRLEQIMSQRAGVKLRQFGYDQLGVGRDVTVAQAGAVQDDYVLGPGDEIVVTLRGQENAQYAMLVDRTGQVTLPRLRPISASGRTFGSVRQELEAAVHRSYVATDAFLSLGQVRQVSVLVSGDVNNPGQRTLSGLSSVVDAILLSGGIKKSGSLRNIRVDRGGRQFTVDLYSVLTDRASAPNLRLADGDRILVPPLGPTVAVTGLVRRPGIFELPGRQSAMTARALLDLGGGQEVRGRYRFSVLQIQPDGRTDLVPLASETGMVRDSEILFAQFGADQIASQATLAGGTGLAGQYPVAGSKLSDMVRAPGALGNAPYTLFGLILRKDPQTLLRTLVAFTPVAVLKGSEDETLRADDVVRVFQVGEIQILTQTIKLYKARRLADQEAIRNPLAATPAQPLSSAANANTNNNSNTGTQTTGTQPDSAQAGAAVVAAQNAQNAAYNTQQDVVDILNLPGKPQAENPAANFEEQTLGAGQFATNREITSFSDLAHQLQMDPVVLVNFLIDHQTSIDGAVRGPGDYFVGPNVSLQDLVQASGGTLNWADQSGVELTSTLVDPGTGKSQTKRVNLPLRQEMLATYLVRPHDALRFNQVFNDVDVGTVTLQGEVRFPGTYSLVRGDHLSDLLARAGGLTSTAYPYGTVFLRKSAAALEHDGYVRLAQQVEDQLLVPTTRLGSVAVPAAQIQNFANELRNQKALGRVSIVADPSMLASRPDLDPLLESGDVLYIPQRPSTVAVLGQVMQQGSYRYERGKTVKDYIEEAGGYAQFSNEGSTYLVLPDGSARKIDVSWLNFNSTALPPGSAIVVPRDLEPFDLRQTVIDVTSIMSQIAVTVASLAVLAKQ